MTQNGGDQNRGPYPPAGNTEPGSGQFQDGANIEPTACGFCYSQAVHGTLHLADANITQLSADPEEDTSSASWSVPYCSMLTKLGLK